MIVYDYDQETQALVANAELTAFLPEDETLRVAFNSLRTLIKNLRAEAPAKTRNNGPVYFINESREAARLHSALENRLPDVVATFNARHRTDETQWQYGERTRASIRHASRSTCRAAQNFFRL